MPRPTRHTLFPFLAWLPRQTRASVGRDAIVGLSGAVLALPQSISQQYMRNHIDLDDLERKARYPQPCQNQ